MPCKDTACPYTSINLQNLCNLEQHLHRKGEYKEKMYIHTV